MSNVATSANVDSLGDNDDEFANAFKEFADAREKGLPVPKDEELEVQPEGNAPSEQQPAPADKAEADGQGSDDDGTSGQHEGAPAPSAQEQQRDDPFADLPDDVRARIAAIEKERDDFRHRASSDANRVSALSRKIAELSGTVATQPKPKEKSEEEKALDTEVERLRKEYGDIADPLLTLIEQQKKQIADMASRVGSIDEERRQREIAAEAKALEAVHPDWQQVGNSPEFAQWIETQPPTIQSLAQSWDAREASVALSLYKNEKGIGTHKPSTGGQSGQQSGTTEAAATDDQRRQQQLEGGKQVRGRSAPVASGPPEDFEAAFEYYRKQREAKQRQGR